MGVGLLVLGAGGHGAVVAEAAAAQAQFASIAFLDPAHSAGSVCRGFPVAGAGLDRSRFSPTEWHVVVAIGEASLRMRIQAEAVASGYEAAVIIHPSAVVSPSAKMGRGSVGLAGSVVQAGALIGEGVIVNNHASVDHGCVVGAFSHIAPGAVLGGDVRVGERTLIGTGASVRNGVSIGDDIIVGTGAAVVSNLHAGGVYVGVPARPLVREHKTRERPA